MKHTTYLRYLAGACILGLSALSLAKNPIVANQGLNDPHIHIFGDTAYVYASHDKATDSKDFVMADWWIWSSKDLVEWQLESTLKPEDTYIGKPFSGAWATDVGKRNGKYYWYFSEANEQTGVVVGDTPIGPWKDPLGKPLLTRDLTPTQEYDPSIVEDKGSHYIIFGVWDFYIAKLNDDMISLAEAPRKIQLDNPYGPYGKDKTDDKPSVHHRGGKYYLSWGAFYAMADNVYGPYVYKGVILNKDSFAPGYDKPTWPNGFLQGRHGNFFEWHNQTYFTYCDISQTGNRYFRDSFISYVHYKENGEMAPIRVDGIGVGEYNARQGAIEAEDYFRSEGTKKVENSSGGFLVQTESENSILGYPYIKELAGKTALELTLSSKDSAGTTIEVHRQSASGKLLGSATLDAAKKISVKRPFKVSIKLDAMMNTESLFFVIKTPAGKMVQIDSFVFM